ncbi:MAG TPA: Hsp20/alpha crystallin family protein [Geminicoccaceae bacterium]|nr:Hsp20/alpha crystallin family protein [Geminicoccaceae bacterium]
MDQKSLTTPSGRRDVAGAGRDPFSALHREINRLFDDVTRGLGGLGGWGGAEAAPRLDIKETENAIEIDAELPGVDEKDVEVQLADGVLTIKGEKKQERKEGKEPDWHLVERSYGSFVRQVALPAEVDEDKVEARFAKGVLTVTLPKSRAAETKTRKIPISGG